MTTAPPRDDQAEVARGDTERMWTARLRHGFFDRLPPDKLLPDEQPAYVSSWIYVFGVLTLAALGRDHRLGTRAGL